ncbi:MAG: hypothetical protein E7465_07505 [Ruminococcaceae bacterium]|nr:hypothetical protein [Oscillospiraceae bacterium]
MEILFVTDFVCPYCLVAKEALMLALKETGIEAEIILQPFELTPEDRPRVDTWNDQRRREGYKRLVAPCEKLGMPMKLPPHVVPRPYTRLAFEGWFFAEARGKGDAYADAAYKAYFYDEQDIGEIPVLAALAEKVGLNPEEFTAALEAGTYRKQEQEAVAFSRDALKVRGVPAIYLNGKKITLNELSVEEFVSLLKGAESEGPGLSCGEHGCDLVYE